VLGSLERTLNTWGELQRNHMVNFSKNDDLIKSVIRLNDAYQEQDTEMLKSLQGEIRKLIKPTLLSFHYDGFFIIDKNGMNLSSSRDGNLYLKSIISEQKDFWYDLNNKKYGFSPLVTSDVPLKNLNGELMPGLSTQFVGGPLLNESQEVIAFFTFRVNPRVDLLPILEHFHWGETGGVFLLNSDDQETSPIRVSLKEKLSQNELNLLASTQRGKIQFGSDEKHAFVGKNNELLKVKIFSHVSESETYKLYHLFARALWLVDFFISCLLILLMKTEKKKIGEVETELDFERKKSMQASKLATVGEMSASIAHEINNPLAIIKASAGTLIRKHEDMDKEKILKTLSSIEKSVDRITKIVSGLKKLSRRSGQDEFQKHSVVDIVNEVITLCEHRFKNKNIKLVQRLESHSKILCDDIEIEQVLVNLVNNAVDAVSELDEKWVRISLEEEGGHVKICVEDSGSGIPEDILNKIFDPFFTTKEVGKGTGLGMSISVRIAHNHQGELYYDKGSKNTKFCLKLPKAA